MAVVLKTLYNGYFWVFRDLTDPRSDNLMLVSSPLIPLSVAVSYLYFIYHLGPRLMENRKPLNITNIMRIYNVIQIISNAYLLRLALYVFFTDYQNCAPVNYSNNHFGKVYIHGIYVYYILKLLDLLDTVFFVLRKSYRQITFLHVYHHCGMVFTAWICLRYVAGGEALWVGILNSFVHVCMYLYYLLATFDEKWKSIRYKKMLTQLQLGQFLILVLVNTRILLPNCFFPKWTAYIMLPQNLFMLTLFGDFYVKTYVRNK